MSTISRALMAHPAAPELAREERAAEVRCIEACLEAAQICRIGADACVEEDAVADLRDCLRAEQDCAVIGSATAQVLARLGFPEPGDGRAVLVPLLEGKPGQYRAEGVFDLHPFFDAALEAGIYLIARPGPYINAEVSGGGFPGWLQRVNGMFRTAAPDFLAATDK